MTEVNDVSTLAAATPPTVTRPWFVTHWSNSFEPAFPVLAPPILENKQHLKELLAAVEDPKRLHPILVVSRDRRGKITFNVNDLAKRTQGLLQIVEVDTRFDTRQPEYVAKNWGVYRGGAAFIFPPVPKWTSVDQFVPVERYVPDQLDALDLSNQDVTQFLYGRFLHRTNLFFARLHLGPERLQTARVERDNAALVERLLNSATPTPEQLEGVRQLSSALDAANERAQKAERHANDIEQHYYDAQQAADDAEKRATSAELRLKSMQTQLDGAKMAASRRNPIPEPVKRAVATLVAGNEIEPEETLRVIEHVFPDRVVVLESAWKPAKEAAVFRKPGKVSLRLIQLTMEFVDRMREGKGDRAGIEIFGPDDYAAKESEIREEHAGARRNRTFTYKGSDYYMERHLKIDNGRSAADGWRCHFTWLPDENRVVIGYCGKHLDFK